MADLKSLLYTGVVNSTAAELQEFAVYNSSFTTGGNGGASCTWTVPQGTSYIKFEMWGGGGGGGGACCCQQGRPGSGGAYMQKVIAKENVVPGAQFRLCAASTSETATNCAGCQGYDTHICGCCMCLTAKGGCFGCTKCEAFYYSCQSPNCMCQYVYCGCQSGSCGQSCSDFLPVSSTFSKFISGYYCFNNSQQQATMAPATVSGPVSGPSGCTCGGCGQDNRGFYSAVFPGGGGLSAQMYGGGCRYGTPGAGGLILVTYG